MERINYAEKMDKAKSRKARRMEKAAENDHLKARTASKDAILDPLPPKQAPEEPKRRKSKPRRKKSPSLSKLKKALWKEISLWVRDQSTTCIVPGCYTEVQCAAHIVPANDGASTRFFLPNLYPCCFSHNESERRQRGSWVYRHREMFGADFVDALYAFSETTFQLKKHWVLEQTERMKKLRGIA